MTHFSSLNSSAFRPYFAFSSFAFLRSRRFPGIPLVVAFALLATASLLGAPQELLESDGPQSIERSVELQQGVVSETILLEVPRKLRPPDTLSITLPAKTLSATVRAPDGRTLSEESAAPDHYTWKNLSAGPDARSYTKNPNAQEILIHFFDFFPAGVYRVDIRGGLDEPRTAEAYFYIHGDLDILHAALLSELTCLIVHKPFTLSPGARDRVVDFVLKEDEELAIFDVLITIPSVSRPNVKVRLERPDGTYLDENSPASASENFVWQKAPIAYEEDDSPFSMFFNPVWLLFPQEGMHAVAVFKSAPKGRYRIHIATQGAQDRATVRSLFFPYGRIVNDSCPAGSDLADAGQEPKRRQ